MPQPLPPDELTLAVARIKGLLLTKEKADRAVQQLAEAIRDAFPQSSGAGVSRLDEKGGRTSSGATDESVLKADAAQYELGQGPCLAAWSTRATVLIHDTATDDRWPLWSRAAGGLFVRSVLCTPLIAGTRCLGTLKVYSRQPGAFDAATGRILEKFAVPMATLLDSIQGPEAPRRFTEALRAALHSRATAHCAQGVLMQQRGFSRDGATRELIQLARTSGQPLFNVSTEILTGAGNASLRNPDPA